MFDKKAYMRKYYEANKEKMQAYSSRYNKKYQKTPDFAKRHWARGIKADYNLSVEEYNAMFDAQDGSCNICGVHQKNLSYRLCVDHNHETGEIRGLLCRGCNIKLGWYEKRTENILNHLGDS